MTSSLPHTALSIALAVLASSTARADSRPFAEATEGSVEATLGALGDDQLLLVEVGAEWCGPCNQLANEVLDTPLAAELVGRDRGLRVDFEGEAGQALKRRFGVLSLPTLLVLGRGGLEVGRVEGYPGRAEWLDAVREARAGRLGLEELTRRARKNPRDLDLAIDLAQARLVRGDTRAALVALDRLIRGEPGAAAARAIRTKGRWLLRVRDDAAAALEVFEAASRRFVGSPHEAGFVYWEASALQRLGRTDEALAAFGAMQARAPDSLTPLELEADFMVHHGYPADATERCVRELLAKRPDAASHYLLARVLAQRGDLDAARLAAARAVELDPAGALYTNYARRLGAP